MTSEIVYGSQYKKYRYCQNSDNRNVIS